MRTASRRIAARAPASPARSAATRSGRARRVRSTARARGAAAHRPRRTRPRGAPRRLRGLAFGVDQPSQAATSSSCPRAPRGRSAAKPSAPPSSKSGGDEPDAVERAPVGLGVEFPGRSAVPRRSPSSAGRGAHRRRAASPPPSSTAITAGSRSAICPRRGSSRSCPGPRARSPRSRSRGRRSAGAAGAIARAGLRPPADGAHRERGAPPERAWSRSRGTSRGSAGSAAGAADHVGDEPGRDQERPAQDHHRAVEDLAGGDPSRPPAPR